MTTTTLWRTFRPALTLPSFIRAAKAPAETVEPAVSPERLHLVEQIMDHNPSATPTFLDAFEDNALRTYLDHLRAAQIPRGRDARWVRPGDSPAIMVRERQD